METYRYYGHFEGDAISYRTPEEEEQIKTQKDCLKIFSQRVSEAGLLDPSALEEVEAESRSLIEQAVAEAKAAPAPGPDKLLTDVYVSY